MLRCRAACRHGRGRPGGFITYAIAVVLELVQPTVTGRHGAGEDRLAGLDEAVALILFGSPTALRRI